MRKNDDKPQQSSTLITIYAGIEPVGGRAAERGCLSPREIGLVQVVRLCRK